jgi:hypothetical protein
MKLQRSNSKETLTPPTPKLANESPKKLNRYASNRNSFGLPPKPYQPESQRCGSDVKTKYSNEGLKFPDLLLARNTSPRFLFQQTFQNFQRTQHHFSPINNKQENGYEDPRFATSGENDYPNAHNQSNLSIQLGRSSPGLSFTLDSLPNPLQLLKDFERNSKWKDYKFVRKHYGRPGGHPPNSPERNVTTLNNTNQTMEFDVRNMTDYSGAFF